MVIDRSIDQRNAAGSSSCMRGHTVFANDNKGAVRLHSAGGLAAALRPAPVHRSMCIDVQGSQKTSRWSIIVVSPISLVLRIRRHPPPGWKAGAWFWRN